jgi:hypothetical protein
VHVESAIGVEGVEVGTFISATPLGRRQIGEDSRKRREWPL